MLLLIIRPNFSKKSSFAHAVDNLARPVFTVSAAILNTAALTCLDQIIISRFAGREIDTTDISK
mgnify:CR=1 FL=1